MKIISIIYDISLGILWIVLRILSIPVLILMKIMTKIAKAEYEEKEDAIN